MLDVNIAFDRYNVAIIYHVLMHVSFRFKHQFINKAFTSKCVPNVLSRNARGDYNFRQTLRSGIGYTPR